MVKLTRRKGFNFFRSYYDVFNELNEKDKLPFIKALLDKQFLGIDPESLKGMAKFGYISQMHSINEQIKGYEAKTGDRLTPCQGSESPPCPQVEVEVEEKEKGGVVLPFDSNSFKDSWQVWKDYKKNEHKFSYKTVVTEQAALMKLNKLAAGQENNAVEIINESIANGWKGFFKTETNNSAGNDMTEQEFHDSFN